MPKSNSEVFVSFRDGSYKNLTIKEWAHTNWIHYTLPDDTKVIVNPDNVNYLHVTPLEKK
jgi:hypothetical protein